MKVENMRSSKGNKVVNQFIITSEGGYKKTLQSYGSTIAQITSDDSGEKPKVELDEKFWNWSVTTRKYRNYFLGETTKETRKKIDSGEYILTNLN